MVTKAAKPKEKPVKVEPTYFTKGVLEPGEYHSPDGVLTVTPDRIRNWKNSHDKLKAANFVIPSQFLHGDKREDQIPLKINKFADSRQAVGKLKDITLIDDGNGGAEFTMEVTDPVAIGRCRRNEVQVSPVILEQFKDGRGTVHNDIIGHVDLVTHAVDYSQKDFVESPGVLACSSIRLSSAKQVFRLSSEGDEEEDKPKDGDGDGVVNEGEDSESEDASDDMEGGDESTEEENPGEETDGGVAAAQMADIVAYLRLHDIDIGDDVTSDAILKDRLLTALRTSAKKDGLEVNDGNEVDLVQDDPNAQAKVADPGYVAMSSLKKFADESYAKDIAARLDRCLKSGRCTPAEHKAKSKERGAIRLSLTRDGSPKSNSLALWLESREALRENSAFDATAEKNKSQLRMSSAPAGAFVAQPNIAEGIDPNDPEAVKKYQLELANKLLAGGY